LNEAFSCCFSTGNDVSGFFEIFVGISGGFTFADLQKKIN
jgi:hypothetical protein